MDKKKKIRYLSIKQEKLEKKLIAEIEKYALNRPKIPKETQNPYQYLMTFNNLIGYFRERARPNGSLFTWTQIHQPFTKIAVPVNFEIEYKEGAKKIYSKAKQKTQDDIALAKNYNTKFFEGVDFTNMNNVVDLLDNPQLAERINTLKEEEEINSEKKNEGKAKESLKIGKGLGSRITEESGKEAGEKKKNDPVINYDNELVKYKSIITNYGRQLISSENYVKHRRLFNITKIQDKNLHTEEGELPRTPQNPSSRGTKTEFENSEFYLNPFDPKNFSVNKILNNIHERNQDKFLSQIEKMRENLRTKSSFLRTNKSLENTKFRSSDNFTKVKDEKSALMATSLITKENTRIKTQTAEITEASDFATSKSFASPKMYIKTHLIFEKFWKRRKKTRTYKQKISYFNPGKQSLKSKESENEFLAPFRKEFSEKLEKSLTNFQTFFTN